MSAERSVTRRQALKLSAVLAGTAPAALVGCASTEAQPSGTSEPDTRHIRLLATSDLHGKFVPWNYATDSEDLAGSMAQLATAVAELRDEGTILIDAGDSIQDNMAEIFTGDEVHPMIACLNEVGYDIGATGNHEYNYGLDVLRRAIGAFSGTVVTGNVWDEQGEPIAESHIIIEKNDVRIGFIGMVTPNITRWDEKHLKGCTVTNPVEETRKIIDQIANDVDVLVGVMHMGLDNEYEIEGSGVRDLAAACPEFDVIIAAHQHKLIEEEYLGDVLVVENKNQAQTMSQIDLTLTRSGSGWKLTKRAVTPIMVGDYEPDAELVALMEPYDARAKAYAREVIGVLTDGPLSPEPEIEGIPTALLEDTAVIDLVHQVHFHYSGADVSAASLLTRKANMEPGDIRRCDVSSVYPYNNTLYTVEMKGAQLKAMLEWSTSFYRQYQPSDLTIGFEEDTIVYDLYQCEGVTYTVDISREAGKRIENLAWPDGTPVADTDSFVLATNNYFATSALLAAGTIFDEGEELPKLKEIDVRGDIGGVRELIADYLVNVKDGRLSPKVSGNWSLTGNDWDPALHQRAVQLLAEGKLSLAEPEEPRGLTAEVITEDDLAAAG